MCLYSIYRLLRGRIVIEIVSTIRRVTQIAVAVVVIFLIMPFLFFRVHDRWRQSVAFIRQKPIWDVWRRRMMMMVMVVGIISTLQSVLMKEILGRRIEATGVYRLRHVEIFSGSAVRNGRRRVHGVEIGIRDSDSRWVWNVVDDRRRRAWYLTSPDRVRRLNVPRVRDFSLRPTCWEEVSQLRLVATVGSWRWRG